MFGVFRFPKTIRFLKPSLGLCPNFVPRMPEAISFRMQQLIENKCALLGALFWPDEVTVQRAS
jgi:hypothetical protein